MLQLIEKCYLLKEKLPLLLIQDLEHFLDYNFCHCGISRQSVIGRINIAISSFPDYLFNCSFVAIKVKDFCINIIFKFSFTCELRKLELSKESHVCWRRARAHHN